MEYIKENCPAFQKGKFCPYNVSDLKGLAKGCPAFKDGCPFKGVKDVGEFEGKMGEMRDECKGKTSYDKALKVFMTFNLLLANYLGNSLLGTGTVLGEKSLRKEECTEIDKVSLEQHFFCMTKRTLWYGNTLNKEYYCSKILIGTTFEAD
jgi:hypothetical protein